jgi:hypothetical protein
MGIKSSKPNITAPDDCRCPHCRSVESIIPYVSIVVSFDNWQLILGFIVLVACVGLGLDYTPSIIFGFGFLAIIPLLVHIAKRQMCHQCGMQFSFPKESHKHSS